jgi:hypothetical protein
MSFWYFFFEGRFRHGEPLHGGKGVFSTCLAPSSNKSQATALFIEGLDFHGIDLVEVKDAFEVDAEELDPSEPDNQRWLEWCEEVRREDTVLFDPWQLFDCVE